LGRAPKFWDIIYHAEEPSDNVAKLRGDPPTELADLVAKQKGKETSAVKHKTAGNYRSAWPNKRVGSL